MIKSKVYIQSKQLESIGNPDVSRIINDFEQGRGVILDRTNIALFSGATQVGPTNCKQVLNHMIQRIEKMKDVN
jgi:hypothetical protein